MIGYDQKPCPDSALFEHRSALVTSRGRRCYSRRPRTWLFVYTKETIDAHVH
jgi:hypothetical protein